jgi:predicted secreted Zn-dependent protease
MSDIPKPPPGFSIVDAAPSPPEGFSMVGAGRQPQHLTFEEGQRLLQQQEAGQGVSGALGAGMTGYIEGIPVIGPSLVSGAQKGSAYLSSLINDKPYEENLSQAQGITESAQQQHPYVTTASNVAGAVGGTIPLIAAAPTAFGAGGGSLLARSLLGGITGGVLGGTDAAVRADRDNRLRDAIAGTLIGGTLGVAGPAVSKGASSLYGALAERMAARKAAEQAGTSPEVARYMTNILQSDESLGPAGRARMAQAGNEAMLVDAGPNARQALDAIIAEGGPGTRQASQAIEGRANRGATDLTNVLDQTLGTPEGITSAQTSIRDAARPTLADVYQGPNGAYSKPIDYSSQLGQDLENIVKNRVPASAINDANRLMRLNGEQSKQILANVADDGTVSFETLPDVRQLDYITRALRQASESGEGQGALGGQTQLGSAYQNLARDIRGKLRQAVPEYGTALDTAADPISQVQAVKLGSRLLSPSQTMDDVTIAVDGMGAAEKRGVAQGIRSDIDNRMANVTRALTDGNMDAREAVKAIKELSSRANRTKVSAAIGKDAADKLFDEVDRVAMSFDLRAAVAENSKTAVRTATREAMDQYVGNGIVGEALEGNIPTAGKRVIQTITGRTPEAKRGMRQAFAADIARYLTMPQAQAETAFNAMTNYGNQSLASRVRAQAIADALSRSAPLVYPSGARLTGK